MANVINQQNNQDLIQEVLSLSNDKVLKYDIHSSHFSSEKTLTIEASRSAVKVIWVYDFKHFTFLIENLPSAKSQWLGSNGWIYLTANKLVNIQTSTLPSISELNNAQIIIFPKGATPTHGVIACDNQSLLCLTPKIITEKEWTCTSQSGETHNICQWLIAHQIFKYVLN